MPRRVCFQNWNKSAEAASRQSLRACSKIWNSQRISTSPLNRYRILHWFWWFLKNFVHCFCSILLISTNPSWSTWIWLWISWQWAIGQLMHLVKSLCRPKWSSFKRLLKSFTWVNILAASCNGSHHWACASWKPRSHWLPKSFRSPCFRLWCFCCSTRRMSCHSKRSKPPRILRQVLSSNRLGYLIYLNFVMIGCWIKTNLAIPGMRKGSCSSKSASRKRHFGWR